MEKAINGIKCDATSCVYHAEGDLCTADKIHVCYTGCNCAGDPNCDTYKEK